MNAAPARREHYLDACRAALMFLGLPVHAAHIYAGDGWTVASPDASPALSLLASFIHTFRMPAFFVIAGYFSLLLLRRTGAATWLKGRITRLGLPLVAAGVLVGPAVILMGEWGRAVSLGLPSSVLLDPGFVRPPPWGAAWIAHLWFLLDLLVLSAGFALVRRHAPARCRDWADAAAHFVTERPVLAMAVGLPLLGLWNVAAAGSAVVLGESTVVVLGVLDLPRLASNAPFFVLGALLAHRPGALAHFASLSRGGAALAIVAAAVAAAAHGTAGRLAGVTFYALSPVAGVLMARLVLTFARSRFDAPSARVRFLVDASYTVYLVHLPIALALGVLLLPLRAPPALEVAVIVGITAALALVVHAAISRSATLLLLFNGVRRSPAAAERRRLASAA